MSMRLLQSLIYSRVRHWVGLGCAISAVTGAAATAQQPGRIQGIVIDPLARPVAGGQVVVLGTGFVAETDEEGRYQIIGVPSGLYTLEARSGFLVEAVPAGAGFAPVRSDVVQVLAGDTVVVNFQLLARVARLFDTIPPADAFRDDEIAASLPFDSGVVLRFSQARLALESSYQELQPAAGQTLTINLFRDDGVLPAVAFEAVALEVEPLGEDGFTWIGRVRGVSSSLVTLVRTGVGITGSVHIGAFVYRIRPIGRGLYLIMQLDPSAIQRDTIHIKRLLDAMSAVESVDQCPDRFVDANPRISLLVLYTPFAVANWELPNGQAGLADPVAGVVADILEAVLRTNAIFEASGIRARLVVTHIEQTVGYDQIGTEGVGDHLTRLTTPGDGELEDVWALRDTHHADIVVLWLGHESGGGKAVLLDDVSLDMGNSAFVVVEDQANVATHYFPHEIGHVLGARHERPIDVSDYEPYRYNHGYVNHAAGQYSVMAWEPGLAPGAWFSNPDLLLGGAPSGVPSSDPNAADNRKALNNTSTTVAAFRMTPVWFVATGGEAPWRELRSADERLEALAFGDFNGDGEADAFRVDPSTGAWFVSLSAVGPWRLLKDGIGNYPLSDLAFADFDADGKTDVFRVDPTGSKWYVWYAVSAGDPTSDWVLLTSTAGGYALGTLGFGDFDGDGSLDVFRVEQSAGKWHVWYSVNAADPAATWSPLNQAVGGWSRSEVALGDFDGDGDTDVFAVGVVGNASWLVFDGGKGAGRSVRPASASVVGDEIDELAFGDFDADGALDVFAVDAVRHVWLVSSGGPGTFSNWDVVNRSCYPFKALAFADLDGDRKTDVFRPGLRP